MRPYRHLDDGGTESHDYKSALHVDPDPYTWCPELQDVFQDEVHRTLREPHIGEVIPHTGGEMVETGRNRNLTHGERSVRDKRSLSARRYVVMANPTNLYISLMVSHYWRYVYGHMG